MREKRFHNQVAWLTFLFSILVIWVHSYNIELFQGDLSGAAWDAAAAVEQLVSVKAGQLAVPGFFMISSYLFFRNFTWEKLTGKWQSRFFSIVVPYIAWNLLYYLGYVTATRLPVVQYVVGKAPVLFSVREALNAVFSYSYAPIFWYLYQLIFLILLAPLIYILVRDCRAGALYLAVLLVAVHFRLDTGHPNTDALFYFSFAAYAALHGRKTAEGEGGVKGLPVGLMVLAAGIFCGCRMEDPGADVLWTVLYRWLLPVSLWFLAGSVSFPETRLWMRQSIFIYAVHYIVVRFVNKGAAILLWRLFAGSIVGEKILLIGALAIYFALPALTVCVSYVLAQILVRWFPAGWKILSGGRELVHGK